MTLASLVVVSALASENRFVAGEPASPPDSTKPHQFFVALGEEVEMRVGDTVALKDTNFSAELTGFAPPTACAIPGENCGAGYTPDAMPDFAYHQGNFTCEPRAKAKPKKEDRKCTSKLDYILSTPPVRDRTAVKVRIVSRPKRK